MNDIINICTVNVFLMKLKREYDHFPGHHSFAPGCNSYIIVMWCPTGFLLFKKVGLLKPTHRIRVLKSVASVGGLVWFLVGVQTCCSPLMLSSVYKFIHGYSPAVMNCVVYVFDRGKIVKASLWILSRRMCDLSIQIQTNRLTDGLKTWNLSNLTYWKI